MSWSDAFRAHIEKRFGHNAKARAADALKVSPSAVTYWCRGSVPRPGTRARIEKWSKGEVPAVTAPTEAEVPPETESAPDLGADQSGSFSAVTTNTGTDGDTS